MHHLVVVQMLMRDLQAQGRGNVRQAAKEMSHIMSSCLPRRGADLDCCA